MPSSSHNQVLLPQVRTRPQAAPAWLASGLARWVRWPHHVPIAFKLALAITVLIVVVMSVLGLTMITNQSALMRNQANAYGQTVLTQLAESTKELILAEDQLALQVVVNGLRANPSVQGTAIYAEDGEILVQAGVMPRGALANLYAGAQRLEAEGFSFDWHWVDEAGTRRDVVSFLAPIRFRDVVVGHALMSFSRGSMVESARTAKQAILIATLSLGMLAVAAAFVMSRRLSRPIYELVEASRAVAEGDYAYRIATRRRDEIGTLIGAFNHMTKSLHEKAQVEGALSRYVSPPVAREILANLDQIELGGKHVRATVLFADIVGFTQISECMTPTEVAEFLNEHFTYITQAAELYRGTVDKFIGDCAMVVFGVPDEDPDHRFNAIACAVLIRRLTNRLNERRAAKGLAPVHFRIGINTGDMLAGNMGSSERMQYTVVGDAVNLASRLSSEASSDEIVVRDEHYLDPEVQRRVLARRYRELRVRGKRDPITVYLVKDVAGSYRAEMDRQVETILGSEGP